MYYEIEVMTTAFMLALAAVAMVMLVLHAALMKRKTRSKP
jgi:hypothetical protein